MLTVMCPKCHHCFPALGCCQEQSKEASRKETQEKKEKEEEEQEEEKEEQEQKQKQKEEEEEEQEKEEEEQEKEQEKKKKKKKANIVHPATTTCYVDGLLMPRGCTSGGGCFINAPTVVHVPSVFHSRAAYCGSNIGIANSETVEFSVCDIQTTLAEQNHCPLLRSSINQSNNQSPFIVATENVDYGIAPLEQHIATACELTDGSITITTPGIQSGGCLIQSTETGILVKAPQIEIRSKLTGGGCLVQKKLSTEDERVTTSKYMKDFALVGNNIQQALVTSTNNHSELVGNREMSPGTTRKNNVIMSAGSEQQNILSAIKTNGCCNCNSAVQQNFCHCQCHGWLSDASFANDHDSLLKPVGNGVQIRVNATVQLPANLGQCMVNITATTAAPPNQIVATELRATNNFHGGSIMQSDLNYATENRILATKQQGNHKGYNNNNNEGLRDEAPPTPVSWLMPSPWSLHTDINRLREIKRLLQTCGWYHEGISWQQSENLLKNASVGRWLMRDSSDSRYTFAVSVQTARGPTSIRVHYFLEQFRLDAEPRLALAMPLFDCPVKMLEHYVEYSKKIDEHRKEVWVDYSGQLYSQIYLTKPLIKEVRSLSHLARLAVNRNKLPTEHLPLLIRNYLTEYPYAL